MTEKRKPSGSSGTPPVGEKDTILSASEQHNDSHHSPRDRRRSPFPLLIKISRRRVEMRVHSIQSIWLSSVVERNGLVDRYIQVTKKAIELGDYATAQECINDSNELLKENKETCEAYEQLSSNTFIDSIVEEIHQSIGVHHSLPVLKVGNTERRARFTLTDLLREEAAQRGATAPPPDGYLISIRFFTPAGAVA